MVCLTSVDLCSPVCCAVSSAHAHALCFVSLRVSEVGACPARRARARAIAATHALSIGGPFSVSSRNISRASRLSRFSRGGEGRRTTDDADVRGDGPGVDAPCRRNTQINQQSDCAHTRTQEGAVSGGCAAGRDPNAPAWGAVVGAPWWGALLRASAWLRGPCELCRAGGDRYGEAASASEAAKGLQDGSRGHETGPDSLIRVRVPRTCHGVLQPVPLLSRP